MLFEVYILTWRFFLFVLAYSCLFDEGGKGDYFSTDREESVKREIEENGERVQGSSFKGFGIRWV